MMILPMCLIACNPGKSSHGTNPEPPRNGHFPFTEADHQRRDSAGSLHGQVSTMTSIGLIIGLGLLAIMIGAFFYFRFFSPRRTHENPKASRPGSSPSSRSSSRPRSRTRITSTLTRRSRRIGGDQDESGSEEIHQSHAPAFDPLSTLSPVFQPRRHYVLDSIHMAGVSGHPPYRIRSFNPMDAPQLNDQGVYIHPAVAAAAAEEADIREGSHRDSTRELVENTLTLGHNRRQRRRMRHSTHRRLCEYW